MYKNKQKYLFEVTVSQFTNGVGVLRVNEFDNVYEGFLQKDKDLLSKTHLYCICKKPRLRVIENSLNIKDNRLYVGFELSHRTGTKREYITLQDFNSFFPAIASLAVNKLQNSRIDSINYNGGIVNMPIEQFFKYVNNIHYMYKFTDMEINGFEVLYVGKASGKDSLRSSIERAKDHGELQKILADVLTNEPYNEVFLLAFELCNPKYIHIMNGSKCHEDAINNRPQPYDIPYEQLLRIAEASLIRYFSPYYNEHYKESFPDQKHKILRECYNHDLNAISMEIDTNIIDITTYSQKVPPSDHHIATFNLHSEEERLSFFSFMKP